MKFTIDESAADQNRILLVFELRCKRGLGGDKAIGELYVPVKELLNYLGDGKSMRFVSYQVRKHSGKPKGALNFSYRFTKKPAYLVEPSAPPFPSFPSRSFFIPGHKTRRVSHCISAGSAYCTAIFFSSSSGNICIWYATATAAAAIIPTIWWVPAASATSSTLWVPASTGILAPAAVGAATSEELSPGESSELDC
jgi:hypothetical protein